MAYQNQTIHTGQPHQSVAAVVFAWVGTVLKLAQRQRSRRALTRLEGHMLKDIGLSASTAKDEGNKAFWQD
ncbi:DUF1127 domain-containing protein [Pseudorhodobacter aquimaris]|uniref:DUF1127 domain-containing protein n=1 Tax=Pseudorhodobacter aquimaris TaxID=687412 RepID=UPI00067B2AAD|nr:DUF1127 domain-containing protein [Pseudorhodobacter aquimaris]